MIYEKIKKKRKIKYASFAKFLCCKLSLKKLKIYPEKQVPKI